MKTVQNIAAQGDVLVVRVDEIPDNAVAVEPADGRFVVAHSETGHHHYVDAIPGVVQMRIPGEQSVCYLRIADEIADEVALRHARPYDTHEAYQLGPGAWKFLRQRESTPEGWRQVAD